MIIAQVTDLHIRPAGVISYGRVDTLAMARAAIHRVLALEPRPDCVVVSGDLTDCGLAEEYALADELLASLPMPVYVIPGNHDRVDGMIAGLRHRHPYMPATGPLNYVIDTHPVRLVLIDTTIAGETHGALSPTTLTWLRSVLATGQGKPTMLVMHHPPFTVGLAGMDPIRCLNGDALEPIVKAHPEIERIVAGHHHRPIVVRFAGTVGYIAPSVVHQVALDPRPCEPNRFVMEPPSIVLHIFKPSTGIVSHVLPVDDFGPVFDVVLPDDYPAGKTPRF